MCHCQRLLIIYGTLFIIFKNLLVVQGFGIKVKECIIQIDEPCNSGYIKFLLYSSSSNIDQPLYLDPYDPAIPLTVNLNYTTKFIIHGYGGIVDTSTPEILRAYLNIPNLNIIYVEWSSLSNIPCYPTAVINTWQVGKCASIMLTSLVARGVHPSLIHMVGFSLGAHVASYAGNIFRMVVGFNVGRITGLDPALPLFATLSLVPSLRLSRNDADYVDIIHSNAGIYGKIEATGHSDFYVNGGSSQPVCHNSQSPRLCSHLMAPLYFAESITSTAGFWGVACPGYFHYLFGWCPVSRTNQHQRALMGEYVDTSTVGVFIVRTNDAPPFAIS